MTLPLFILPAKFMIKKCNRFVIAFYLFVCYNIFIPIFYSHLKGVFIKRIAKIGLSLFPALSILVNGVVFADEGIIPLDVNYNGVFFYCDVDSTIVQETNTWCGVASTLMALTGIENYSRNHLKSGYVRPTQKQIANNVINSENSAVVHKVVDYLNSMLIVNKYKYYYYRKYSLPTDVELTNKIKLSLAANRPVILWCNPYKAFKYYVGDGASKTKTHYVVIDEYDAVSNTFNIVDPTYVTELQGRHRGVTVNEILKSISNVEGYIICS